VVVPAGQVCCGALHAHAGDERGAARLLAANLDAFEAAGPLDAVAVTAAGCGSALKEGARRFPDDPALAARAQTFADGVRDTLELLDDLGLPEGARGPSERVACLDACHLAHAQQLPGLGRRVLSRLPGLELVSVATSDRCCGSAGIYNLLHPEEAATLGDERLAEATEAGAEVLATANAGCLMHLSARARATGSEVRCEHPLSLLDRGLESDA
jgi:glycolate oxidase iron-sulfur subunit